MLIEYIENNFKNSEPIFLDEIPYKSKEALRQEMKKLTDEGKLIRLYNGVYYQAYKTIFGTNGKMSIDMFVQKKFISNNDIIFGYLSGMALYNKYGFTTQIPAVIEVTTNFASTKLRKLNVDGYSIIVNKSIIEINEDNINELIFLDIITNLDKYSEINGIELESKLKEVADKLKVNFSKIKQYLKFYPDKTFKNLYFGGFMSELV